MIEWSKKPQQNIAFNNQIEKHVSSQQTDTLLRQSAETSVGYSLIKIFVRQPYFVGDNTKGNSKTCQYVPGLNKDRFHPSPSLATLCSTTTHKVGNYTDRRNDKERINLK